MSAAYDRYDDEPVDNRRFIPGWSEARGHHVTDYQSGRVYYSPDLDWAWWAAAKFNRQYPWGAQ